MNIKLKAALVAAGITSAVALFVWSILFASPRVTTAIILAWLFSAVGLGSYKISLLHFQDKQEKSSK